MKVALLGYGVVGKGIEQLLKADELVYIFRRNKQQCVKENMITDFNTILNDESIEVVIEVMGGLNPAYEYCKKALCKHKHVISANKKMLAHYYKDLVETAKENNVSILFSSAVGGGIRWLANLLELKNYSEISAFKAIANGTSNYIADKMFTDNLSFAQGLKIAQKLGYAEADPSDDIDGIDTTNKMALSANILFDSCINPDNIFCYGIRNINEKDLAYCRKNNLVMRLIGQGKKSDNSFSLATYPVFLKTGEMFSSIHDNYNCFMLDSAVLAKQYFIGQGAGSLPTANNVIADLNTIKNNLTWSLNITDSYEYDEEIIKAHFYIRYPSVSDFEIAETIIDSDSIISKEISLKQLRAAIEKLNKADLFIAEVQVC